MAAVSKREWERHASGQADSEQAAEAVAGHAEPGQRPAPPSPRPASRRPWSARAPGRPARAAPAARHPAMREAGSEHHPGAGHRAGVPQMPPPLPAGFDHVVHDMVLPAVPLDVGPAKPYYDGEMAHGVPMPPEHGGRPAPRHEDRAEIAASRPAEPEDEPRDPDPVPVYIVEMGSGNHPLARVACRRVTIGAPGTDPVLIAGRDPHRRRLRVLNESSGSAGGQSAQIAAGAGPTTITLPAGATLTGLDVSTIVGASSTSTTIAIAGTAGGTLSLNYVSPASGIAYLPQPIPPGGIAPASSSTQITVTFNGVTNTGSGWMTATWQVPGNPARFHPEPGSAPGGVLLPAAMTSYLPLDGQDEIWAVTDAAGTGTTVLSVISEYDVPAGG
jgi:hypothetical protein